MTERKPNESRTDGFADSVEDRWAKRGWITPNEARTKRLRRQLLALGVAAFQVDHLLTKYSLDSIEQQLQWLPLRGPKKPAALIVSAIVRQYEAPAATQSSNSSSNSISP